MTAHYISFPALGWKFFLDPVLAEFTLFGREFSIRWYGALIATGFLLAVIYASWRGKKLGINSDRMMDAVLLTTLVAFVGARLYYVLFCGRLTEYLQDPLSIFAVWNGGLGIYGGVITAFLFGSWMCRIKNLPLVGMFDLASLGFLIGQCIGRWGNFFNQEAFGGNTALPWGMTGDIIASGVNGSGYDITLPVHPTFFYESIWCLLGFILLHILSEKAYRFQGELFCGYLVWYGVGRFFIEALRTDSLMIGPIRTSQLVAVLAVAGGTAFFFFLRKRGTRPAAEEEKAEEQNDQKENRNHGETD